MAKTYTPIGWEDGEIVKQATVTIDNVEYDVNPAEVEGTTPVTAENLRHMDEAIKELYDEGTTSKDIVIGTEAETTEDTKLLIETDTLASLGTEVVDSLAGNESYMAPSVKAANNTFVKADIVSFEITTEANSYATLGNTGLKNISDLLTDYSDIVALIPVGAYTESDNTRTAILTLVASNVFRLNAPTANTYICNVLVVHKGV